MTTDKPEVVAYIDMLRGQETRYATLRGDIDPYSLNDGDELIRLSDYEALQAKFETLRQEVEALQGIQPEMRPTGKDLPRYGVRWNGPTQPLPVPKDDGYWTPWHMAQTECEKLRKEAERYRSLLEAVQGEPVGYVSPRLLKSLLYGKACGITMEDKPDAHNGVTIPLYIASPAVQMEVVGWQFYEDGKWWNGDDRIKDHRKNTEEAGFRVRDVYAAPQPAEQQPDATQLVEALTELCDEIDKHEIHAVISKTSISWFKRKARAVLAAHRKQGGEA